MKKNINKKYDPSLIESKWYEFWLNNHFFKSSVNSSKKPYTILMPPPNVTGILHMGHVLNNTIQDILVRRARLLGYNACWVPGIDHASIATEAKVVQKLKKEGIHKKDLSREEFLKHAWDWKEEHGNIILNQLKKLGSSCDWDRVKFTMDQDMSESVIEIFIDLYERGLIYKGERMVNWDSKAKTAVSDEEVIYKEQNSDLYYVDYKLVDSDQIITIATTRPETILGDTGICVHPEDERYKALIGKKALVPLVNREIPIITDYYIDPEFGTGALKVTPAHDINDYEIGKRNNLEIISVIDNDGLIHEDGALYVGKDRFYVREQIIKDINSIGQLNKIESIKNKVGFSERTNEVIEPKISMQWFFDVKEIAKPALESVLTNEINFFPNNFKKTYKYWMENIKDWCISRQLWWGHRIPVFYYKKDKFVVAKNINNALEKAKLKSGDQTLSLLDLKQDEDVLDTWFSSWIWPISVFDGIRNPNNKEINYYYPTSDLVTGPDILFFWVARMVMAGFSFKKTFPFKNVYFTGIVRDKKRRKMSKSLGNSPDALGLIDKYGADGVRSGMLFSSNAGNDLLFDEILCEQGRNFSNKIWNAFRLVNSWEVSETNDSQNNEYAINWFESKFLHELSLVNKSFDKFRISESLMKIYKLIWDDFCSSYLEMIKPSNKIIDSFTKNKTIYFFEQLMVCLHPFMPFISEQIWQDLKLRSKSESIVFAKWPEALGFNENILKDFDDLFKIITVIRKIRKEQGVSAHRKLNLYTKNKLSLPQEMLLKKLCALESIHHNEKPLDCMFPFLVKTEKYYLNIDFDSKEEINKINKEILRYKNFLNGIEKKLNNKNFVKNAPDKVISLETKKKEDTILKIKYLENQILSFS